MYLLSPHPHTRMQMHLCMCMRKYIHVHTPTKGTPVREVSLVTRDRPIRGFSIWQTHTRGFHPCYYLAVRPHLVSSVHLYEYTHTHTHNTCLHICELVRCSDIWRRGQKREREERRDREWRWLINDYVQMYSIFTRPGFPPLLPSEPKPRQPE